MNHCEELKVSVFRAENYSPNSASIKWWIAGKEPAGWWDAVMMDGISLL